MATESTRRSKPQKRHATVLVLAAVGVVVALVAWGMSQPKTNAEGRPLRKNGKIDRAYPAKDDPKITKELLGPRTMPVIDIHEHVQSERDLDLLLEAMDEFKIERTCLVASTIYTFTLSNRYGFEEYEENNEALLQYKKKHPDRLCVFVTIDPAAEGNLEKLQDYVKRGADGLKLYLGHGAAHGKGPFHVMPLDDERMEPIYAWAEEVQLPILMHVNLIKYFTELRNVLERHPYLRLCVPHLGLHKNTKKRLDRLAWLLERYPNLYTDISFGWYEFHIEGFEALARWRGRSRDYFVKHANKIMYASDMVIEKTKDRAYVHDTLRSYFQLLESEKHRLFLKDGWNMWGLSIPDDTLKKIYWDTPATFLQLTPDGHLPNRTSLSAPVDAEGNVIGKPPTVPAVPKLSPDQLMRGEGKSR
jgi:predicted TIM-barrel fold metal-dependent hydrolase